MDKVTQEKVIIISGDGKDLLFEQISQQDLHYSLGGDFVGDVTRNYGPWQPLLMTCIEKGLTVHPDSKMVDKIYLSEKEFQKKYLIDQIYQ